MEILPLSLGAVVSPPLNGIFQALENPQSPEVLKELGDTVIPFMKHEGISFFKCLSSILKGSKITA